MTGPRPVSTGGPDVPGEHGCSLHWDLNVVHIAEGAAVGDIVGSPYVSDHYPEALSGDIGDIRGARDASRVTINGLGVVAHRPVVPPVLTEP